ncbi:MAG: phage tail sheath subtilisin-like domain-containing protein, partial [Saprospiraceae bacterium]
MPASYLHGVETVEIKKGARPVQVVKSAVVGLVGIAPKGTPNSLTAVLNPQDAATIFGAELPGFSIPQALSAIYAQGTGTVLVVNIFDPATMTTAVTNETVTVTNGKAKTAFAPTNTVIVTNNAGTTTYVKDTDYAIDDFGNLTVLNFTSIVEGSTIKFAYSRLNAASITPSAIIGSVSGAGVRTGFKCLALAYSTFGYTAKVLIAPNYSQESTGAVAAEMIAQAEALKGIAIIDTPNNTTVATALTGRGPSGTLAGWKSSSKRAVLAYPNVKVYDAATDAVQVRPYSQYLAGVISATDLNEGYWISPSNHEIQGIVGPERTITAAINDASTEANALNEVGIVTQFNSFGTGIRVWGNRSASWPTNTAPDNFISVRRTADILHESVEYAMLPFIDRPITQATIDAIR